MKTLMKVTLIFGIAGFAVFGADNTLGTWKLNVEKSTFNGVPISIKSLNVTREASDGGVKETGTGERPDGAAMCNGPQKLYRIFPFLRWWAALKMKESQCPERARITRPA
jgi:hypothetical protein